MPGVEVRMHDDGSSPGMHDLNLFRQGSLFGACEVTAAADAETIELWKLVNGRDDRWVEPGLRGGWMLALAPTCRAKTLKAGLRDLLLAMETQGVTEAGWDRVRGPVGAFDGLLDRLGIVHARQGETEFPGVVYFTIDLPADRSGGAVPLSGDPLVEWLSAWTRSPEQEHNVAKLLRAGTKERHLFVLFPVFSPAPFPVIDVLMRPSGPLPTSAPDLPDAVTHLWTMSGWSSGDLFAWSASGGWSRHSKDVAITVSDDEAASDGL